MLLEKNRIIAWTQLIQRRSASKFPHACSFMLFLHYAVSIDAVQCRPTGESGGGRLRLLPFGAVPNPMTPLFPVAVCFQQAAWKIFYTWNDMYSPSQDKVYSVRVLHNTQRLGTHYARSQSIIFFKLVPPGTGSYMSMIKKKKKKNRVFGEYC